MIRHVVMFDFLEEAEGRSALENARIAQEMLEKLPEQIPWIRRSETGLNHSGANQTNYHLCLIADFDSQEDLERYIVHPDHVKVGEFMKKVRRKRSCVDYELYEVD